MNARRHAIARVLDHGGRLDFPTLAARVVAYETGRAVADLDWAALRDAERSLARVHVPALLDAGVVEGERRVGYRLSAERQTRQPQRIRSQ